MRLRIYIFSGLAAFSILISGCKAEREPIKVAFCAGLSGKLSELGVSGRKGAEIAVEEINSQGGINDRPVELLVRDDKSNADEARRIDSILINEGCIAIIGHFTSGAFNKALSYAAGKNTIMISPTISTSSLSGRQDNFFRTIAANRLQAELLARAAWQKHNSKKVSVLYEKWNRKYSEELYFHFRKEFERLGGKITVVKSFTGGQGKGFASLAKELTSNNEDGILSIAAGADNAMLCQQLSKHGSDVKVYAGLWSMSDDLLLNGGKTVERVYISGVFDNQSKAPGYVNFKNIYLQKYNTNPTFGSVFSYEAAMMLFSALKAGSSFDQKSLGESIIKIGQFKGLQQDFRIDRFGDADERAYRLFTVKNNQFVLAGQL